MNNILSKMRKLFSNDEQNKIIKKINSGKIRAVECEIEGKLYTAFYKPSQHERCEFTLKDYNTEIEILSLFLNGNLIENEEEVENKIINLIYENESK